MGKNTQLAQAVVMSNIGASRSVEFATQATDRIKRLLLAGASQPHVCAVFFRVCFSVTTSPSLAGGISFREVGSMQ